MAAKSLVFTEKHLRDLAQSLYDVDAEGLANAVLWWKDHATKRWIKQSYGNYYDMICVIPLSEIPCHINDKDPCLQTIAKWRLQIGK